MFYQRSRRGLGAVCVLAQEPGLVQDWGLDPEPGRDWEQDPAQEPERGQGREPGLGQLPEQD